MIENCLKDHKRDEKWQCFRFKEGGGGGVHVQRGLIYHHH